MLMEWPHFPLQAEQSPLHLFQVRCLRPRGSTAHSPIVWLAPASEITH